MTICRVEELPVVGFGVKTAVAPEGSPPMAPNVTAPGKFVRLNCTVNTAVDPGARVTEAGVAVIVNELDSCGLTVRPAETLPLTFPLMP